MPKLIRKYLPNEPRGENCDFKLKSEEIDDDNNDINSAKKIIKINISPTSKNRQTRVSELITLIILENQSGIRTIYIAIKTFFCFHLLAISINLFTIWMQNIIEKTCFLYPICKCNNDLGVKVYSFLKDFIFFWLFQSYMMFHIIFHLNVMDKRIFLKALYLVINIFTIAYLYFCIDGDTMNNNINVLTYGACCLCLTFFYLIYLFLINFQFKLCITNFYKGGFVTPILVFNYLFVYFCFNSIELFLNNYFETDIVMNLMHLISTVLFSILAYLTRKFLFSYYELIIGETSNKDDISIRITTIMRFCFSYVVATNSFAICNMKFKDWGAWIILINYSLFLIKSYTQVDVYEIIFSKMVYLIFRKNYYIIKQPNENQIRFGKIYSGCSLDVQFICCSHFLILFLCKRWSRVTKAITLYKNCQLEISDQFSLNLLPILLIISINFSILLFVFIYMKKKKIVLLFYTIIIKNKFANLYVLLCLHYFIEALLHFYFIGH